LLPLPPSSPLFPYTTLFRSHVLLTTPGVLGAPVAQPLGRRVRIAGAQFQCEQASWFSPPCARRKLHGRRGFVPPADAPAARQPPDRKSTRLNSSHVSISYAV